MKSINTPIVRTGLKAGLSKIIHYLNGTKAKWAHVFLLLFLSLYLYRITLYPTPYWDSLPYMASVYSLETSDPKEIHQQTYQTFTHYASEEAKQKLLKNHPFCQRNASDPDYFQAQLIFFKVKSLYVGVSYLFYRLGAPLYYAVHIPSWLALVTTLIFLYAIARLLLAPLPSALFSSGILCLPFNLYLFSIASPDAFSGMFIVIALWAVLTHKSIYFFHLSMILAILARPEVLVFYGCWVAVSLIKSKPLVSLQNIKGMAFLLGAGILVSLIYSYSGYDGSKMFYRSFIDLMPHPANMPALDTSLYFQGLKQGLKVSLALWPNYLLVILLLALIYIRQKLDTRFISFGIAFALSTLLKFLMHPALNERFIGIYLDIFILIALTFTYLEFNKNRKFTDPTEL